MSKRPPRAFRVAALWICLLTIWTQLLAPAAALAAMQPPNPFSVICSHAGDGHTAGRPPGEHGDHGQHSCCPLCHVHATAPADDPQPAFTRLDYPLRSPQRWICSRAGGRPSAEARPGKPRGPPSV